MPQLVTQEEAGCRNSFPLNDSDSGDAVASTAAALSFAVPSGVGREEEWCGEDYFCPIFVPSKARHQSSRGTISLLIQDQVPFTVVVEPQEVELYEQLVDRLVEKWWGCTDGTLCQDQRIWQNVLHDSAASTSSHSPYFEEGGEEKKKEAISAQSPAPSVPSTPSLVTPQLSARVVRQLIKIEALPLSDQGVSYVRNHILTVLVPSTLGNCGLTTSSLTTTNNSAISSFAEQWFWVMDDDIQRFNISRADKNHAISPRRLFAEVYRRIHRFHGAVCDMRDVAIFSLEYSRYAYTYGDADIALNSYNNIASLFRYDLIPPVCSYRFRIREDYDFTLQLILHGLKTARFRNLSFDVPQMAVVPGGMTDYYKTQKEDIRLQNGLFLEAWPSVAQQCIKGKGSLEREDMRVRWDLLHPKKNSNPSATLRCRIPLPSRIERRVPVSSAASPSTSQKEHHSGKEFFNGNRKGAKKQRQPNAARSDGDDYSDDDDEWGWEWYWKEKLQQRQHEERICETRKRVRATESGHVPPGWKGYVLEKWRDLSVAEAERLHLRVIPSEKLRVGQTVAVVPPLFDHNPSVVEAVLVDKSVLRKRKRTVVDGVKESAVEVVTEWNAVARGMPLLTVTRCYEIPAVGMAVAASAVDAFFEEENGGSELESEG